LLFYKKLSIQSLDKEDKKIDGNEVKKISENTNQIIIEEEIEENDKDKNINQEIENYKDFDPGFF
jgi:hypothetical protein